MVLVRERFLDDSSQFHLSLELVSRSVAMHALLTGAAPEAIQRIGDVLVSALDEIAAALRDHAVAGRPSAPPGGFGCGT